MNWTYTIEGTNNDNQTWKVNGILQAEDMHSAFRWACKEAFWTLTEGKAEYGSPGKGCRGPYRFTHLTITEENLQ